MSRSVFHLGEVARRIFSLPRDRNLPTLVLDLDETVLHRPRGLLDKIGLYAWPSTDIGVPYSSFLPCIYRLRENFDIVAVTARWRFAEANTARWLSTRGLGGIPVIYAREIHPGDDSRVDFKASAIRFVREKGWNPVMGVGDRPSDLSAYVREGLSAMMVIHAEGSSESRAKEHLQSLLLIETQLLQDYPGAEVHYFGAKELQSLPGLRPGSLMSGGSPLWELVERKVTAEHALKRTTKKHVI